MRASLNGARRLGCAAAAVTLLAMVAAPGLAAAQRPRDPCALETGEGRSPAPPAVGMRPYGPHPCEIALTDDGAALVFDSGSGGGFRAEAPEGDVVFQGPWTRSGSSWSPFNGPYGVRQDILRFGGLGFGQDRLGPVELLARERDRRMPLGFSATEAGPNDDDAFTLRAELDGHAFYAVGLRNRNFVIVTVRWGPADEVNAAGALQFARISSARLDVVLAR